MSSPKTFQLKGQGTYPASNSLPTITNLQINQFAGSQPYYPQVEARLNLASKFNHLHETII